MKRWWVAPAVLAAAILVVVLFKAFGNDPRAVPFMLRGHPAPTFSMRDITSGNTVSLEQLKGKPVVMNFWASWCGPCMQEHPVLEWGGRTLGQQAHFVGVVFEDTEENARRYIARNGSSFPQLLDERGKVAVEYGASGVPETYFIDRSGVIVDKFVGPIDPETLAQRVQALAQ